MLNYFTFAYAQNINTISYAGFYSLTAILVLLLAAFLLAVYHAYIEE
jgi:hypothetical protein